jgi:hypothetical protein
VSYGMALPKRKNVTFGTGLQRALQDAKEEKEVGINCNFTTGFDD